MSKKFSIIIKKQFEVNIFILKKVQLHNSNQDQLKASLYVEKELKA